MVGYGLQQFRLAAGPGTAEKRASAELARAGKDRGGVDSLRVHGADHHEIGPSIVVVVNLLDCVVQQAQSPGGRAQSCDRDEAEGRRYGIFVEHGQNAFESPKGRSEARPHEKDFEIRTERRERRLRSCVTEDIQAHREIYAFDVTLRDRMIAESIIDGVD